MVIHPDRRQASPASSSEGDLTMTDTNGAAKKATTPEEIEAAKAEVSRLFAAMDPDEAAAVWLEQASRVMAVFHQRAAVRAVEGRQLSVKDQAGMAQLSTDIAKMLEITDPDRIAERRLARLDRAGIDPVA